MAIDSFTCLASLGTTCGQVWQVIQQRIVDHWRQGVVWVRGPHGSRLVEDAPRSKNVGRCHVGHRLCLGRIVAEGADFQRFRQSATAEFHAAPQVRNDGLVGQQMLVAVVMDGRHPHRGNHAHASWNRNHNGPIHAVADAVLVVRVIAIVVVIAVVLQIVKRNCEWP